MKNISSFKKITPESITDNTFKLIGTDWMLITAGNSDNCNTMTASWGGFGILWNKPVAFCFIRPQRHTYSFIEKNSFFTLSFFDSSKKDILQFCGSQSGKKIDKIKETGLTKLISKNNSVYFEESRLSIECRILYKDDLKENNFIEKELLKVYPNGDFHRMYIGEITECLIKD